MTQDWTLRYSHVSGRPVVTEYGKILRHGFMLHSRKPGGVCKVKEEVFHINGTNTCRVVVENGKGHRLFYKHNKFDGTQIVITARLLSDGTFSILKETSKDGNLLSVFHAKTEICDGNKKTAVSRDGHTWKDICDVVPSARRVMCLRHIKKSELGFNL